MDKKLLVVGIIILLACQAQALVWGGSITWGDKVIEFGIQIPTGTTTTTTSTTTTTTTTTTTPTTTQPAGSGGSANAYTQQLLQAGNSYDEVHLSQPVTITPIESADPTDIHLIIDHKHDIKDLYIYANTESQEIELDYPQKFEEGKTMINMLYHKFEKDEPLFIRVRFYDQQTRRWFETTQTFNLIKKSKFPIDLLLICWILLAIFRRSRDDKRGRRRT